MGHFDKISDRNLKTYGPNHKKLKKFVNFGGPFLENMGQMAPWPPPEL